jgi:uncharacterized protein (DUF302 family)
MDMRIPAMPGWSFGSDHSHWRPVGKVLLAAALALGLVVLLASAAAAQGLKTYTKKGNYDDVKLDLTDAITKRGLVVDYNGNVGGMLDRTGKDVGSTKQVYKKAEYFTFCSAKLSRDMMDANSANVGYCPYVVYIFEATAKPGEVVVGYRRMPSGASGASAKALKAVDAMLEGIVKDAVK